MLLLLPPLPAPALEVKLPAAVLVVSNVLVKQRVDVVKREERVNLLRADAAAAAAAANASTNAAAASATYAAAAAASAADDAAYAAAAAAAVDLVGIIHEVLGV